MYDVMQVLLNLRMFDKFSKFATETLNNDTWYVWRYMFVTCNLLVTC